MAGNESEFKVSDRRLFTEDGNLREDISQEDSQRGETPIDLGRKADSNKEDTAQPEANVPMNFQTLVLSLSTTAMFQLGVLSDPSTGKQNKDLQAAKQTIDILQILEDKTKGNLTSEESQLLEASLYDLKMAYLNSSKKP